MAQANRFYLKLPIPGGRQEYVEVDLERLTLDVLTQVYTRTTGAGGAGYQRAHGVEAVVNTGIDPAPLLERVSDRMSELHDQLDALGETGGDVKVELSELATQLHQVLSRLATGHVDEAADALSDMLYRLTGVITELVAQVERYGGMTDGLQAVIDRRAETEDGAADAIKELLADWARHARKLLEAVSGLHELEQGFREYRRVVEDEVRTWYGLLSEDSKELTDIVSFFNGDAETDSFLTAAYLYIRATEHPDESAGGYVPNKEEMHKLYAIARAHMSTCLQMSIDTADAWQKLREQRDVQLGKLSEVRLLIVQLREASTRIRTIAEVVTDGMMQPYDLEQGALISRNEFNRSQTLRDDVEWAPITCEQRIVGILNGANSLIGQTPQLPLNLPRIVAEARDYIDRLERMFATQDAAAGSVPAAQAAGDADLDASHSDVAYAAPARSPAPPARTDTEQSPVRVTQVRLNEIVELVICVAYELGGKIQNNFAGSTVFSMLDLLVRLGKITKDEAESYRAEVREHLARPDVTELVTGTQRKFKLPSDGKKGAKKPAEVGVVSYRWHTSQLMFIKYKPRGDKDKPGGKYFYKLTKGMESFARALLGQHGLTEAAIREVIVARKAEYKEKLEDRTQGQGDGLQTAAAAHDEDDE